jgi:hypothetical protein
MKKLTYLLIVFAIGFTSCSEDDPKKDPTIEFITDSGYTYENTSMEQDDTIYVGINAEFNGDDKITLFEIKANNTVLHSETTDEFELERTISISKSNVPTEEWTFEVTDAGGRSASVSIILTLEYGEIITNNSVVLGAQDNPSLGSFYSTQTNEIYLQGDAFNNQSIIDILYYYDATDLSVIASPGAQNIDDYFTGTSGIDNWTTLNETRYTKTDITVVEFDAISDDSIILNAFDADDSNRKAKNLAVGDVYAFRTENGKKGLFKVIAIDGEAAGTVEIAIKVQD